MRDPIIFYDHIVRGHADLRRMFEAVASNQMTLAEVRRQFVGDDGTVLQSALQMWTMLYGYRYYGQQTFVVGPRLREMFENTSLSGVPWDAVRWPYPFFYVAVPDCPHQLQGGPTGLHDLAGIVVGFSQDLQYLSLYLWGAENARSRGFGDDASFWFDIPVRVARESGLDVETYLERMMRDPNANWSDGTNVDFARDSDVSELCRHGAADESTIQLAKNALRTTINLCIYLQCTGAELAPHPAYEAAGERRRQMEAELRRKKNPRKKAARALQQDLDAMSTAKVTWLGRAIEEQAEHDEAGGRHGPATRVWVRGHWWPRLANHEARERHPLRWVQPHIRNRDEGDAPPRHYRVACSE